MMLDALLTLLVFILLILLDGVTLALGGFMTLSWWVWFLLTLGNILIVGIVVWAIKFC